jgi:type II secretory pathway pseudopilin PulG
MWRGERARRRASGFTYVGLLAVIVLIGLMLGAAGEVAATAARRDREAQLLWVGHEYRAAIGRYWNQTRTYPQALQELLGAAPDAAVQVRYIRRLYPDPMTNAVDWVLVPAPSGGIMGVASSSKRAPLKTDRFDEADKGFKDASSYGDWQFTFVTSVVSPSGRSATKPATTPPSPGVTHPVRAPSSRPR